MLVTLVVLNQGKLLNLPMVITDQTACEGLVDKTDYRKADWDCSELFHT